MGRFLNRGRYGSARDKSFCFPCNVVVSYDLEVCPHCGGRMRWMSSEARPPKRTASARKWKAFWRLFPYGLTETEKETLK